MGAFITAPACVMYGVCVDSNTLFVSTWNVSERRPFLLQEPPGPLTGVTSVTLLAVVVCAASCRSVQSLGWVSCEGTTTVQGFHCKISLNKYWLGALMRRPPPGSNERLNNGRRIIILIECDSPFTQQIKYGSDGWLHSWFPE